MYLPKDLIKGLEWMEKYSQPNDTVVCTWATGSFIPIFIENPRPWVGHPSETLYFKTKAIMVKAVLYGEISSTCRVGGLSRI